MKTSELIGVALDWAVAKCEGYTLTTDGISTLVQKDNKLTILGPRTTGNGRPCGYSPSTDWAQGGPIIEREKMTLQYIPDDMMSTYEWEAQMWDNLGEEMATGFGSTPLIAAMCCYVASKLGNEIEVPDGIIN